jgi:hypothetical protein
MMEVLACGSTLSTCNSDSSVERWLIPALYGGVGPLTNTGTPECGPNATHPEWTDTGALTAVMADLETGTAEHIDEGLVFWAGSVLVFEQDFAFEYVIRFDACSLARLTCSLQASKRVTNGIPLGCSLPLTPSTMIGLGLGLGLGLSL